VGSEAGGCSGDSRSLGDAQQPNTPRLPASSALASRLCAGWLGVGSLWLVPSTFSLHSSAVRIMKKQGRKIKSSVDATAEATWVVPGGMLVGVFPY